ncbi:hypothetical protein ADUPG1_013148 [Aduncisulcus paluster]|uniref:Uncharacterized protein n=1 Tax=Aduncisulcus paluster TaxID=2918883 RepID=A0ABQ5K1Y2_9EUKA|nr:hypothetical protein ADUPG1_013148 [Aduncisulcus paluster]
MFRRKPTGSIEFEGHEISRGTIFDVDYKPDMDEFVTASSDHALRIWDSRGRCKRELFKLNGHQEWVVACSYTSTGGIVSAGMDSRVLFWPRGSARAQDLGFHKNVSCLTVQENFCYTGGYDGCIKVWDLRRRKEVNSIPVGMGPIMSMCMNSSANCIFVGCKKCGVAAFDLGSQSIINKLKTKAPIICLSPSKDPRTVFAGNTAGEVIDVTYKRKWPLSTVGTITDVVEATAGNLFVSSADGNVYHLFSSTGEFVPFDKHRSCPVTCLCSSDGIVVSGDASGNLHAHEIESGKLLWAFGGCLGAIRVMKYVEGVGLFVGGEAASGVLVQF